MYSSGVRELRLAAYFLIMFWISVLRSDDKDSGTVVSAFVVARPCPTRPFTLAASLPLDIDGTVCTMIDGCRAGDLLSSGVGVVDVGGVWIKVCRGPRIGHGPFVRD